MYTFLNITAVLAALLLIGIVLIQKSKGSGLTTEFSDIQKHADVQASAKFVERATLILAGIIAVICIVCPFIAP